MDLGVMHSGADGVIAPVMAQIEKDTTLMAILSLENNREIVDALREATQVQGKQAFNTTMAQSQIYFQDYLQSRNSAIAQGAIFGFHYAQNLWISSKELGPAEKGANIAGKFESEFKEARNENSSVFAQDKKLASDPNADPLEKEAAAKRLSAQKEFHRERLEKLKAGERVFTSEEEMNSELAQDIEAVRVSDSEDYEKIMKNLRKEKKSADQRVSSATAKQDKNIQTANILSNIVQSAVTAATKYQQSQISQVQAKAEMIKVLSEYTVQIFQQLMQLTLGVYNQQVDRVNQLIQAQATIAQLNRAA